MGNLSGKQQLEQPSGPSANKSSISDNQQPFDQLPELIGPDKDGFYYHKRDKDKVDKDIQFHIEFKFKYNAIDYDPNRLEDMKDDEKQPGKFGKCRYEWIYIAQDNIEFHRIKEPSFFHPKRQQQEKLPEQYENIRKYLVEHDPIPSYFLRQSKMADMVLQQVLKSSLCQVNHLKCRIATRCLGKKLKMDIYHPALLIWNKNEQFGKFDDKPVMLIHLTKLAEKYKNEQERKEERERIEIQCRPINKYQLDKDEWKYDYEIQDLELSHGLIDIAHWSLKYEMDSNYEYGKYMKNCRRYMEHLCIAFKIKHDAHQWTDSAVALVETAQEKVKGSKTWSK